MAPPDEPSASRAPEPGGVDRWRAALARLAALQAGDGTARPAEETRRILRERARAYAAPVSPPDRDDHVDVVVLRVGDQRIAVGLEGAGEVVPVGAPTPLPGVPPVYLGLTMHRGLVYPLIDVRPLLGLPAGAALQPGHALLVEEGEAAAALAVEAVVGVERIAARPAETPGARHPAILGMAADGTIYLDPKIIILDARLTVS